MWGFVFSALSKGIQTGINYFSERRQANAYRRQGEMENAIYGKDADLAEHQAQDAIARGELAANREKYKMRTTLGAQAAGFAGQGVSLAGGGTPAALIKGDQALGTADILNIRESAAREAWGYRQQESIYRDQGQLALTAGKNMAAQMNLQSIGTLANFGGDMFSMYKGYTS